MGTGVSARTGSVNNFSLGFALPKAPIYHPKFCDCFFSVKNYAIMHNANISSLFSLKMGTGLELEIACW